MKQNIIIFCLLIIIFSACHEQKYSSYRLNYTNIMYEYRPCNKIDSPYIQSLTWQPKIYLKGFNDTLKIYYTIDFKCDTNNLYLKKLLSYEILDITVKNIPILSEKENEKIKCELINYFIKENWCLYITYLAPSKYSYFNNGICKWHSFGHIYPIE